MRLDFSPGLVVDSYVRGHTKTYEEQENQKVYRKHFFHNFSSFDIVAYSVKAIKA